MTRPMRVGIDARALECEAELRGAGVIAGHLIEHLRGAGVELVLFFHRTPDGKLTSSADRHVVVGSERGQPRAESTGLFRLVHELIWEQVSLPRALRRERLDIYHAPANRGLPLLGRGRFIVTIHDLIPLVTPYFFDRRTNPSLITRVLRVGAWLSLAAVTWKAQWIITDSASSHRDIARLFPWARGKMTVIYPGVDRRYQRIHDASLVKQVLTRHSLPTRFLLFVGGLGQRKNIAGLLRAYALLVRSVPTVPDLVVVGRHTALLAPLQQLTRSLGVAEGVHFPGFIPTADMPALLSAADLLVYPSFYEGFGLPVLEAIACGCPVVCADTSSLPEVGADAVHYCDPASPQDIAEKIRQVLADDALRMRLIEKGLRRAQEFRMDGMAADVLSVYRHVLAPADGAPKMGNQHQPSSSALRRGAPRDRAAVEQTRRQ